MPLLVIDLQLAAIPAMKRWTKPQDHYVDIRLEGNVTIRCDESRARLAAVGFAGEILPTPGHSDDSVSLLLDDGSAFTGDLTIPQMATVEQAETAAASWRLLRARGARRIHPGHGPVFPIEALK